MPYLQKTFSRRRLLASTASIAAGISLGTETTFGADPIRIGFGMSLTGPLAPGGKQCLLAMEVWRDETNAKGGLNGRPVQLIYYDDQSNPANVPGLYAKLLDIDNVDLVVSPFATNQIAPAMPIVMDRKRVYMALFGTGVNDGLKYDRYFQILPNGPESKRSLSTGYFDVAMRMDPRPQTVAIVGSDAEFSKSVLAGARANIEQAGLKIVYDDSYPPTTPDFTQIVRAIQAANPDIVFVASYPADSAGIVRSINELDYRPKMFGGAMIGLSFAAVKGQFGPALNGIVTNDNYVPEPTMKFPGVEDFLQHYQERAPKAGVDALGYFLAPFAYAALQILGEAVTATGSLDQGKLAAHLHDARFKTIVGDVKFGPLGEWEKTRILTIQYQHISGKDLDQFKQPGKQVILYPPELKSGDLIAPFAKAHEIAR
jgi:branched-chain amino acid transport system substrate-binding protein